MAGSDDDRDDLASDSGDRRLEFLVRDRDTNTGNAVSVEKMTSTDAASVCLGPERDRSTRRCGSPIDASFPCQTVATGGAGIVAALSSRAPETPAVPGRSGHKIGTPKGWRSDLMSIIAWIVLGAIAGYLAGFLVRGDEGLGVIGHIVLGIVGALIGGFLAGVLFNTNPINGPLDISSIVTAVIGAIIVVVVVNAVTGRTRTGRGAI